MTDTNLVSKCRSDFSPTTGGTAQLAKCAPSPRQLDGMSEAMDGRGQAHMDVLAAVPSSCLGQGLSESNGSPSGRDTVGLKPDPQQRAWLGGSHGT